MKKTVFEIVLKKITLTLISIFIELGRYKMMLTYD